MRRAGLLAAVAAASAVSVPGSAVAAVRIGARSIVLTTAGGRAVITRAPFRIAFTDRRGRTVLAEARARGAASRAVPPPPAPLAAGYEPALQGTLYAPLAFTVGTEDTRVRTSGQWAGNLLSSTRTGTIYRARSVRSARRTGRSVRLVVRTSDPSGRVLLVTVGPDRDGAVHVRARPSPAAGVAGVADAFASGPGEAFHGFGGRHVGLDQHGQAFTNWLDEENVDAGSEDVPGAAAGTLLYPNGPAAAYYASASFVSSRGYGFLLDRPELARFRLDAGDPRAWQADVSAHELDYVVAPGAAPRAIRTLTAITGRHRVPPAWAVRPSFDRETALGETPASYLAKVRGDLTDLARHHVRIGAYRLEGWGILPTATVRSLIAAFHRRGIRVLLYFRAFVAKDAAGTENGALFDTAVARGFVPHTRAGKPALFGDSFGGTAALVDFTNPAAVRWWQGRIRAALDLGADGFMQDFGEEALPGAIFRDGESGLRLHNRYPALYHRATRQALDAYRRTHTGRTFFFFTRAGYSGRPGAAAYENANFPGDEETSWTRSAGIASVVPDMLNRAVGGAFGYTTDIGGYFDLHTPATTRELFLRWAELAVFTPFFRLHGSVIHGLHTPWGYGPATLRSYNALAALHARAAPLILRLWRAGTRTGMPPTRPLWLADPGDPRAARQDQEWLLGPDLLAAPVVAAGARARAVFLPPGCWRRAGRGAALRGPATRRVGAPVGSLPYFVRCGAHPLRAGAR